MTIDGQILQAEREEAIVKKVLARLLPFLAILYIFCLLDRTNVSVAALTMQKDLGFSNAVYGLGAGVFFIGYFLFEIPSNLILERVGARWWITRIMLTWGAISAAMMFVRSPFSFYALRFLLGLAEAGFYPGVILYLTYWVPANARARVIARFLALTAILGVFNNPLGGFLLTMDGIGGLAGWQWLFLLEGVPSILMGFVVFKVLPDTPAHANWLSADEKDWLIGQLAQEAGSQHRVQHMSLRVLFTDLRIFHLCLIFIVSSTAMNAVGFFGPQLVKDRSHGVWPDWLAAAVLAIPAIVGAIAMTMAAHHSDRTGRRRDHVSAGYIIAAVGFLACVFAPTAGWTVFALAINALGERIGAGSFWVLTTNLMGARAAAAGIALINSVGNLGGFIGPTLMGKLKDVTHGGYAAGLYTAAAMLGLASILAYERRSVKPLADVVIVEDEDDVFILSDPEKRST